MSDEVRNDETEGEEYEIDLGAMDDTELERFEELLVEEYGERRSAESFSAEDRDELKQIAETIKAVRAEMQDRIDLAAADDLVGQEAPKRAEKEELADEEPEAPVEEEPEAPAEEEKADEELAKEDKVKISPKGIEGDTPVKAVKEFNVVASADVRGFKAGQELKDWSGVAKAFVAKRPDIRGTDKGSDGNRFLVASVHGEFDEAHTLNNDIDQNMVKIDAVTNPQAVKEAITASGGFCAMLPAYYPIPVWGDANRPVRDALPVFKAERGGIRFMPSPVITDLAGSTRHTTAAQDAAGYTSQDPAGTTEPKPCLHVTCETEQSSVIEAIHRCLTFGNLGARTYPEQVEAWIKLGLAEFARYAETRLLDKIAATSTALDATQVYGAVFSLLDQVSLVVASHRARHRLSANAPFRALFPYWAVEILKSDIAAQGPGDGLSRFDITDEQVERWLRARGVSVTWYQDHTTAAGAPFGAPSVGGLWSWPTEVEWFIYPEGTYIYLDGGSLDLGLVRDSALNSVNDYQIFYEEFNTVTKLGPESYKVTSTLCANGTYAPADDLRVCPTS